MTEPAAHPAHAKYPPEGLRRVAIDPLTRVEGHGKVTLLVDDRGQVQQARLHIVEFRGFEQFIVGRPYWEVPVVVARLCGICPVSHHLAAAKAMDVIVGAERLPASADKLRRLMHYGQVLQSHALHFFHLAAPDLLFGWDAEPRRRNIAALASEQPDTARRGILLRKFGQEIIAATAGKRIHGTNAIPGGVSHGLERAIRQRLAAQTADVIAWSGEAVVLASRIFEADAVENMRFGAVGSHLFSLVDENGGLALYEGKVRVRNADGLIVRDQLEPRRYLDYLAERVEPWSYMKFPFLSELGPEAGWYKVGPLARVQNCDFIPTPMAEAARLALRAAAGGATLHAPLAYHWARMIEMLHAAEVVAGLLGDPELEETAPAIRGERRDEAVGVLEAPRGTLIHHYRVGADDLVTACNLIVSTTHNNQAMNEAIREVARQQLDGHTITDALLNRIEVAIRAFDPCLSCATHALGQMPLQVEVLDAEGKVVALDCRPQS